MAETDFADLLEGVPEAERASRLALLERLQADGCTREELHAAHAAGRLSLLPVERLLARRRRHSLIEAARLAGLSDEYADVNHRSLGLPLPQDDEPVYDDDQLENLKVLRGMIDLGVPEEDMHAISRIFGRASHRTAQAMVDVLSRALVRPGDTEADLALRLADLAEATLPVLDRMSGAVLRLHLLDVIQRETVLRLEGDSGQLAGSHDVTIAFADLAGFTALSERLPIEDLGRVASRFEELVLDLSGSEVRLVKVLGDGAMLAAEEPAPLVGTLLDLVDAAADEELPPVHAGVAHGPALHSAGDWLGRTVNVAARLCAVAPPWTVLATGEAATEPHDWAEAGTHRLRGIAAPVAALRAVRRSAQD
jgi:adenylate cyclase